MSVCPESLASAVVAALVYSWLAAGCHQFMAARVSAGSFPGWVSPPVGREPQPLPCWVSGNTTLQAGILPDSAPPTAQGALPAPPLSSRRLLHSNTLVSETKQPQWSASLYTLQTWIFFSFCLGVVAWLIKEVKCL